MAKIIFEINYNIYPEKRSDYLKTIGELKQNILSSSDSEYSVYENNKTKNNFSEIFVFENEEKFDAMEDNQSEESMMLTQKLFDDFIVDRKVTYSTKHEVL